MDFKHNLKDESIKFYKKINRKYLKLKYAFFS